VLGYVTINRIQVGIGEVHDVALKFTSQLSYVIYINSLKIISVF